MRIEVRVIPRARREGIEQLGDATYKVKVTVPAAGNRANERALAVLSEHFGVPRRSITMVRGHRGRVKIIDVRP